jgi:hypothetical protein
VALTIKQNSAGALEALGTALLVRHVVEQPNHHAAGVQPAN